MKKSSTYLTNKKLILLTLLLLLSVGQGFAGSKTYYARLTATATGEGKVYASKDNTPPEDKDYATTSSADNNSKTENQSFTFYAFAKANDGYAFKGWSNSQTGDVVSSANPYEVTVTASSISSDSPSTTTVYAQFIKLTEQVLTFLKAENGTYTATDGTYTVKNNGSMTTKNPVTLTATPTSGYKFFGWYTTSDGGKTKNYFSYNATTNNYVFTSSVSVGADFVSADTPIFVVKGGKTPYTDLNVADKAASGNGTIVLISDGTLPIGNYSISKGNTLLIPYDDAYTVKTTKAEVTQTWAALKAYKTLTLQSGANITVQNGAAICVGGKQFSTSNPMGSSGGPGTPTGSYGCINMSKGGNITLQSGSNLYAWGFITGQNMDEGNNTTGVGTIDAQNGANVYEDIVIADWHGGNATSKMNANKKYFPFNQYFIPNIEVPLTINYGATLNTVSDISAGLITKGPYNVPITFIAKIGGLFNLQSNSSSAKLWYDATTDEQHFELTGDNTIEGISANVGGYVTVDASKYVMPMTSNFDIHIKSGSLTIPSDVALLPGAKVTLDEGVTATINQGANVFVYDLANWGPYSYGSNRRVYPFRPTKFKKYDEGYNQTKPEDVASKTGLADAQLVVNGALDIKGNVYTTEAGADICSTGYGQLKFSAAPSASTTTYQVSGLSDEVEIKATAPQLHNADKNYVATSGASANTTYYYDPNVGAWATTEPAAPSFSQSGTQIKLDKAYLLTNGVTEKFASDLKTFASGKNALSADLTMATGTFNATDMRSAIGATDDNNVLLYAPANATADNINNVVVNGTCANFVITDKQPIDVPTKFTAAKVSYNRTNTKNSGDTQWGTICLPFELTSGNGIQYYELKRVSGNTMTFERVDKVDANTPAIYSVASVVKDLAITGSGMDIAVTPAESNYAQSGFTLVGVQKKAEKLTDGSNNYYIANNKFWKPTGTNVNVGPQRAYFQLNGNSGLAKVFNIALDDGEATGIDNATIVDGNEPAVIGIYSINGVKQTELRPGINIIKMSDGTTKKIIIK